MVTEPEEWLRSQLHSVLCFWVPLQDLSLLPICRFAYLHSYEPNLAIRCSRDDPTNFTAGGYREVTISKPRKPMMSDRRRQRSSHKLQDLKEPWEACPEVDWRASTLRVGASYPNHHHHHQNAAALFGWRRGWIRTPLLLLCVCGRGREDSLAWGVRCRAAVWSASKQV